MSLSSPSVDEAIILTKDAKTKRLHQNWDSIADVLAAEVERLREENAELKKRLHTLGVLS
jgi:uncharacterized protein YceH (UPF0502 family)